MCCSIVDRKSARTAVLQLREVTLWSGSPARLKGEAVVPFMEHLCLKTRAVSCTSYIQDSKD